MGTGDDGQHDYRRKWLPPWVTIAKSPVPERIIWAGKRPQPPRRRPGWRDWPAGTARTRKRAARGRPLFKSHHVSPLSLEGPPFRRLHHHRCNA